MADAHAVSVTLGLNVTGAEKLDAVSDKIANIKAQAGETTAAIQDSMPKAAKALEDIGAKTTKAVEDLRAKAIPAVMGEKADWPKATDVGATQQAAADAGLGLLTAGIDGLKAAALAANIALVGVAATLGVMGKAFAAADQWSSNLIKTFGQSQRAGESLQAQQQETAVGMALFGKNFEAVQYQVQRATTDYATGAKRTAKELDRLGLSQEMVSGMQAAGEFTPQGLLKYFVGMKESMNTALEQAMAAGQGDQAAAIRGQIGKFFQDIAVTFGRQMETTVAQTRSQFVEQTEAAQARAGAGYTPGEEAIANAERLRVALDGLGSTMSNLWDRVGDAAAPSITNMLNTVTSKIQAEGPAIADQFAALAGKGFDALRTAMEGFNAESAAATVVDTLKQIGNAISVFSGALQGLVAVINTLNAAGEGLTNLQSKVQEFGRDFGQRGITAKLFGEGAAEKIFGPKQLSMREQAEATRQAEEAAAAERERAAAARKAAAAKLPDTTPADLFGTLPDQGQIQAASAATAELKQTLSEAAAAPVEAVKQAKAAKVEAAAAAPAAAAAAPAAAAAAAPPIDLTGAAAQFASALAAVDLTPAATAAAATISNGVDFASKAAGVGPAITAGIDFSAAASTVPATINAGVDFSAAASTVASTINAGVNFSAAAQAALATLQGVSWTGAASAAGETIAAAIRGAAAGIKVTVTGSVAGAAVSSGGKPTGRDVPAGD